MITAAPASDSPHTATAPVVAPRPAARSARYTTEAAMKRVSPMKPRPTQEERILTMRQKRSGRPRKRRCASALAATIATLATSPGKKPRALAKAQPPAPTPERKCPMISSRPRPSTHSRWGRAVSCMSSRSRSKGSVKTFMAASRARRVLEVAERAGVGRAGHHAGGLLATLQPVRTEVALHHHARRVLGVAQGLVLGGPLRAEVEALLRVEVARLVGAGLHAVAAADADLAVDVHDAVGALERGARGAHRRARRGLAVHAEHGQEDLAHVRVGPGLALDHAGEEHARRRRVLRLAAHLAAVAAEAALEVDHHSVSPLGTPPFAQRSRLRFTGLVCSKSTSRRSLKKTPLPWAMG